MTPSELRYHVAQTGSCFFARESMRFFGDTMKNYGVRRARVMTKYDAAGNYCADGIARDCWELYRKNPVKHGLSSSAYFDVVTFERVHTEAG